MKARDVLFRDLTTDEVRSLPKAWGAVYFGRPRDKSGEIKVAMRLRFAVLVVIATYALVYHRLSDLTSLLLFLLLMYEAGYYSLRKDKALLDWSMAYDEYRREVEALPDADA
jgi:hypothetical protein